MAAPPSPPGSVAGDDDLSSLAADLKRSAAAAGSGGGHGSAAALLPFVDVELPAGRPLGITFEWDGSLRVVNNGIAFEEQAKIEMPGLKGLWALRPSSSATHDQMLVQTFIGETRILSISDATDDEDAEMEEASGTL